MLDSNVVIVLLIVISLLSVPAVLIWVKWDYNRAVKMQAQRKVDLAEAAKAIGADYFPEDPGVMALFRTIPFFPQAEPDEANHRATGVIHGLIGGKTPAYFFDFNVFLPTSDGVGIHFVTVAMFDFGSWELPVFQLERLRQDVVADIACEQQRNPIGSAVTLVRRKPFTANRRLHGPDAHAINAFFRDELCEYIEQHDRWAIESTGRWLAVCRKFEQVPVKAYPKFVEEACGFLGAFAENWRASKATGNQNP
jgi:hypothetical protein